MNEATLKEIEQELSQALVGERAGRVFQLDRFSLAIDFRLRDHRFLFVSVEPRAPRIYLIRRRLKDLEKEAAPETPFLSFFRKSLSNARMGSLVKLEGERVLKLSFQALMHDPSSNAQKLIIQLTGRSANLFLTDESGKILISSRQTRGKGQEAGDLYTPPVSKEKRQKDTTGAFSSVGSGSLSEALDSYYLETEQELRWKALCTNARGNLKKNIKKKKRLRDQLTEDLQRHGDPGKWKRYGDLLMANVKTAERRGNEVLVTDYYDERLPVVAIEVDPMHSIQEAASIFFRKSSKAKNAKKMIAGRLDVVETEIRALESQRSALEDAIADQDREAVEAFVREKPKAKRKAGRNKWGDSGVRRFVSSDGLEILVGKRSKDNDHLTFRTARSLDTWLHAADYPGSHVVIRNSSKRDVPHRTLLEAAGIAAFYSKARNESKAAVHYTLRKFVHKPRGAKPGLVSLASFKTVLVVPGLP